MSQKIIPLVMGGLIPAVLYGVAGVFQKLSAEKGGSAAAYLIGFGLATALVGVVFGALAREPMGLARSIGYSLIAGTTFSLGAALISIAMIKYKAPVSQLSPLYNTNVLITVLLGLWLFSERQSVQVERLLGGAVLILIGALLVANA